LLKWSFLILILQSCGSVKLHDSRVCFVAGVVEAGADCATMLSSKKYSLDFDGLIDMLQPSETEKRGGAAIIPIDDFIEIKKTIEMACQYVKCKKSIKNLYLKNINYLLEKSRSAINTPTNQ